MRAWRPLAAVLAGVAALVLQASVVPVLAFRGLQVDVVLVACVLAGVTRGVAGGAAAGAGIGLAEDVLAGRHLGLMLLARAAAGSLGGLAAAYLQRDRPLVPALAALAGTILQRLAMVAVVEVAGAGPVAALGAGRLWLEAVLNGLLASLVYLPVLRVAKRLHTLAA